MAEFTAEELIVLAIKTAASAAGGKIGTLAGNEVLTVLGLKQADLADVTSRLDTIDGDILALKHQVAALADTTSWTAVNSDLTKYQQEFETGYADLVAILKNVSIDEATRDARLTAKLRSSTSTGWRPIWRHWARSSPARAAASRGRIRSRSFF